MNFIPSTLNEDWLNGYGLKWKYEPAWEIAKINERLSLANKGRLGDRLLHETIDDYAYAMMANKRFPALIGYRISSGELVIIDGMQRLAAAKAVGYTTVAIYVVKTGDPKLIDLLSRSANHVLNGQRPSEDETTAQAIIAHETWGFSIKEVALAFGLTPGKLESAMEVRNVVLALRRAGEHPDGTKKGVLQGLLPLCGNEEALLHAFQLAKAAHMTSEEMRKMRSELQKANSPRMQLNIVERWAKKHEIVERVVLGRKRPRSDKVKILAALKELRGLLTPYPNSPRDFGLTTQEEFDRYAKDAQFVCARLNRHCTNFFPTKGTLPVAMDRKRNR